MSDPIGEAGEALEPGDLVVRRDDGKLYKATAQETPPLREFNGVCGNCRARASLADLQATHRCPEPPGTCGNCGVLCVSVLELQTTHVCKVTP